MQEICPITRMFSAVTTVRGIITEKAVMEKDITARDTTAVRTNTAAAETEAATRN